MEIVIDFIFLGSKITVDGDCSHKCSNTFNPWKKSYDKHGEHVEKQRSLCQQRSNSQSYDFFSSHVQMQELDHKEGWVLKNRCFSTVKLEKNLETTLDCKEIKPANPKGNQSWTLIGKTKWWNWNSNTLATWWEELNLWKRLDSGKIEGRRRRG